MSAIDRAADRVGDIVGAVRAFVGLAILAALLQPLAAGRHRTGDDHLSRRRRPAAPHPRPKEDPVAVNFSLNQAKLTPAQRKASRNPRAGRERRASSEAFELHAERRGGVLPWAAPARQRIPVSARERHKVARKLERDGWTVHTRKARRGWFW